jgi:spore coat polysaccharide biosynthesis predicted glycosyltransferase SpsG
LQPYDGYTKIKENSNIFLFVGGYDKKKLSIKILKLLNFIDIKLKIFLPASYKKIILDKRFKHQLTYFKSSEYLQNLYSSNIAITAGGIGLFDAILAKKKILCFSQYLHQETNIKKIEKLGALKFFNINENKTKIKFCKTFLKIYHNNDYEKTVNSIQNQLINNRMLKKTFYFISKIYEKSQTRKTF